MVTVKIFIPIVYIEINKITISMKNSVKTILIISTCLFLTTYVQSQNWSQEQTEVWKVVEGVWDAVQKGDAEIMVAFFHEDYKGWEWGDQYPRTKKTASEYFHYFFPSIHIITFSLEPMAIIVKNEMAVIHYYYTTLSEDGNGNSSEEKGRWTDIYVKEKGKWLMIADSGGESRND